MRELGAGPVEGFLGHLARGHILHRADEHRPIRDSMGEAAQVLDDAARRHDAEVEVGFGASQRPPDRALVQRHVLGVDDLAESPDRDRGSGLEVADSVELIGPVVLVSFEIRGEAARLAQPLGLGQMVVGPPKLRLSALQVVDIRQQHVPADDAPAGLVKRKAPETETTGRRRRNGGSARPIRTEALT